MEGTLPGWSTMESAARETWLSGMLQCHEQHMEETALDWENTGATLHHSDASKRPAS